MYEVARKSWLTWVEVELLNFTEHADCRLVNSQCRVLVLCCQVFSDMFYVIFSSILKLLCDKLREFQCVGLVAAAACVALCELH